MKQKADGRKQKAEKSEKAKIEMKLFPITSSMIINFNKEIYHKKAIDRAIQEFKHLADFNVQSAANYIMVHIENIDKEVAGEIKDEFCNYVIYASYAFT